MSTMRRALVTGVSRGLGKFLARRLADEGWDVWGVSRALIEDPGVRHLRVDLAADGALGAVLEWCPECPDLVIHNAVAYPGPPGERGPEQRVVEDVLRVNAVAPYLLTLEWLRRRSMEHFCSFIVVNSEAIYHADEKSGLYAASKAAVRVLATSLASSCKSQQASVSTLLLGPLADEKKVVELRRVAEARGVSESEITALFLQKSNPDLVIRRLIEFEACFQSVRYIVGLQGAANGMLCRLDGGAAGSLV